MGSVCIGSWRPGPFPHRYPALNVLNVLTEVRMSIEPDAGVADSLVCALYFDCELN